MYLLKLFFSVLITIEPSLSSQFVTTNYLKSYAQNYSLDILTETFSVGVLNDLKFEIIGW